MPIMIRLVILTPFANPTGHARLTVRRTPAERVACEFSGLTPAVHLRHARVNDSTEREGHAGAGHDAVRCNGRLDRVSNAQATATLLVRKLTSLAPDRHPPALPR
jgi:hypothetical protein